MVMFFMNLAHLFFSWLRITQTGNPKTHKLTCLWLVLWFVFSPLGSLPIWATQVQSAQEPIAPVEPPVVLEVGKPIEKTLSQGEKHLYAVNLQAGEYVRVDLTTKGINVAVLVEASNGTKVAEVNLFSKMDGKEEVEFVAEKADQFQVLIFPPDKGIIPGKYTIQMLETHPATEIHRDRVAGRRLLEEGVSLEKRLSKEGWEAALNKYDSTLPLWRKVKDQDLEVQTLQLMALTCQKLGRWRDSIKYFEQVVPLMEAAGERNNLAIIYSQIASCYDQIAEYQKAFDFYNKALPVLQAEGDKLNSAAVIRAIGSVYSRLGNNHQALEYYLHALQIFTQLGNKRYQAMSLNSIGITYQTMGEIQKAIEYFQQSIPLRREVEDKVGEAVTLGNIGNLYLQIGELNQAIDFLNKALELQKITGDKQGEITTLANLGSFFINLGEIQKALEYYQQALEIAQEREDIVSIIVSLIGIGLIYRDQAKYQKALTTYTEALSLARKTGSIKYEPSILSNLGELYFTVGEFQRSIKTAEDALELARKLKDRPLEGKILHNIGTQFNKQRLHPKALEYLTKALEIHRATGNKLWTATTLNQMSSCLFAMGETQKGIETGKEALKIRRELKDRSGETRTLLQLGHFYRTNQDYSTAADYYQQSLALSQELKDKFVESRVWLGMAQLSKAQGNLEEAQNNIEQALKISEALRSNVTNQTLRTSFFGTIRELYDEYIEILMRRHALQPEAGFDRQALNVSENARARSLIELLTETRVDIRQGVDPNLLTEERLLVDKIAAGNNRLTQLLLKPQAPELKTRLEQELDQLTTQYRDIQAKIRQESPQYAAISQPQPLTAEEIQSRVLDENSVLLEFALGTDQSYVWAVSKTGVASAKLPKQSEIEPLVRKLYDLVQQNRQTGVGRNLTGVKTDHQWKSEYQEIAAELSRMLLEPVAGHLKGKRLLIVPDGALHYLPFAVLPEPGTVPGKDSPEPLLVNHEIVTLPSAATLVALREDSTRRKPASRELIVLADPVFSLKDPRVSQPKTQPGPTAESTEPVTSEGDRIRNRMLTIKLPSASSSSPVGETTIDIPRLQYTRDEANQIAKLIPSASQKLKALDFAATRERVESPELNQYRYIHFATHGLLDSQRPELTSLVLSLVEKDGTSKNGFLRAFDVFNLNLSAELVVLSACQTGLGQEIRGEGMVGLTRGFMYAGAKRVVVSLWEINDLATAKLMEKFYRKLIKNKLSPPAALRAAQLEMWRSRQWNSPFYWAAFQLQGEYQK